MDENLEYEKRDQESFLEERKEMLEEEQKIDQTKEMEHHKSYINHLNKVYNLNKNSELTKYTEEDYKRLQENLLLYKTGNLEAASYIIQSFHPFLIKYIRFLFSNDIIVKNWKYYKSIHSFIKLFMTKADVNSNESKKNNLLTTAKKIRNLYAQFSPDDIYNELVCTLLDMANRYKDFNNEKKPNGSFHTYVLRCFHYEAFRKLSKLTKDPIAQHLTVQLLDSSEFETSDGMNYTFKEKGLVVPDPNTEFIYEKTTNKVDREYQILNTDSLSILEDDNINDYELESLNFNWINGVTCSELFQCLTLYERELIILSFVKNKTDADIGKIYGYFRITINKHKLEAIRKLREEAKRLGLIKD